MSQKRKNSPGEASRNSDTVVNKADSAPENLKHQLEELRKSEERYHRMIEEVEDYAILLLDANGIVQNWNKGAQKIKGYREDEIVGKSFSNFYFDEDRKRGLPQQLLEEARTNGRATHEGWRCRKDGSRFWGSIVITALHDKEGNVVGFSKVTRDLTERKDAEDKLKQYASQLEFQNKELEQFAYAASHDMKEPLRKIHFYNQFVIEHAADVLDAKCGDYLQRSILAAERLTRLIEDLLTYSRTESPADSFEETNLDELVEEIVLSHKDLTERNELQIEKETLPVISAIPFQFKQLFDNLVNNSINYKHPERKSIIRITCDKLNGASIQHEEADKSKDYYKISLQDNGVGFDQEHALRIFEIFQRLQNLSGYRGSGIGLALCKKIVQNHGGFITATGKAGKGARFDVYIPL